MSTPQRRDTGTDMLLVEVADSVATLTFNNPEKRNAMSTAMRNALPGALTALQDDPEVRVIVATGAGGRAFVSGADISEFGERRTSPEARAEWDRGWAEIDRAWKALDKPVIAMIRGFCIGGGLLTALQADIRIATDDSQFGVPGRPARARLRLRRRGRADQAGRPGGDRRDPLLRAALQRRRGPGHGPGQPDRPGATAWRPRS